MDKIKAAKYIKDHCLGSEVYRDGTQWNDAMVTAVEVLEQAEEVSAIKLEWIGEYLAWLESMDADVASGDARAIKVMLAKWKMEQENVCGCSADACPIKFE